MKIPRLLVQLLNPFWFAIALTALLVAPYALNEGLRLLDEDSIERNTAIAPLFTDEVQFWGDEIAGWATQYNIDPNLIATIMQIESCGHPTVASTAGAQGLFQVMPFHFADGEDMLDPDTNALRSANFIRECGGYAGGDPGLIMACYNGGPSVVSRPHDTWYAETQRYYHWGVGIYNDALQYAESSHRLDSWLNAGGVHLCRRAEQVQRGYNRSNIIE